MAAVSSFLWEEPVSPPLSTSVTRNSHQSLPSVQDLAQGVPASGRLDDGTGAGGVAASSSFPRNDLVRDSGNWSMPSQSKHSSTASFATGAIQFPTFNASRTSPGSSRLSAVSTDRSPRSSTFPYGGGFAATAEEPRPTLVAASVHLAHLNQPFEPHPQIKGHHPGDPADVLGTPPLSRPRSVNSRMTHLVITSPHASANASQTSLVAGLQRDRGFPGESTSGSTLATTTTSSSSSSTTLPVLPPLSIPASSSSFSSSAAAAAATTTSLGRRVAGRTAPPIGVDRSSPWSNSDATSDNPVKGLPWAFPDPDRGPNPNAMKPTKGQPWAFPDPELAARPSSKSDHDRPSLSRSRRRDSVGDASVASSFLTTDSKMVGDGRLPPPAAAADDDDDDDDDHPSRFDDGGPRPISVDADGSSTDLTGPGAGAGVNHHHHHHHHHHHSLQDQHRTTVHSEPTSPAANTPYSRTPELRVSHKLAERKRRSEMKNLFEELRMILPADGRVSKSSKWEILTKAIDYTKGLEQSRRMSERRAEAYRADAERCASLQREVHDLREEIQRLRHMGPTHSSISNLPLAFNPTAPLPRPSSPTRPSLHHHHHQHHDVSTAPSSAMQGVQFST